MSRIVAFDVETIEIQPDGSTKASTEFYRDTFRVDSAAFTERVGDKFKSWFVRGEEAIRAELKKLEGVPLVAHNAQYELGVCRCRFPDVKVDIVADTMRQVQCLDNGGDKEAFEYILIEPEDEDDEEDVKKESISGLGLVKSCRRILGEKDHKEEAHTYLRKQGIKKGQEGAHLNLLPEDILERYNVGDTEATLRLYEHAVAFFEATKFNWQFDHGLFLSTVHYIVDSKIRGVLVDRQQVYETAQTMAAEIVKIEDDFLQKFENDMKAVERLKLLKRIRKLKRLKGRKNYVRKIRDKTSKAYLKEIKFNPGSDKQLAMLFVDVLGIEPKFFTPKGSPSFKGPMLHQWGSGGLMLQMRRKHLLVLKQACNLYKLTEYDGRWHVDLKAAGTSTGRFAGGSH